MPDSELLSKREVAEICAVGPRTIDNWRAGDPTFPRACRIGNFLRWVRGDVENWRNQKFATVRAENAERLAMRGVK